MEIENSKPLFNCYFIPSKQTAPKHPKFFTNVSCDSIWEPPSLLTNFRSSHVRLRILCFVNISEMSNPK